MDEYEGFYIRIKADNKEALAAIAEARAKLKELGTDEITIAKESTAGAKQMAASAKGLGAAMMLANLAAKAISAVFSAAAKAMNEGMKNAYEYSRLSGDVWHKALDKFSSKWEAIKNSLGAGLITLVNALEPVITRILDSIISVVSKVSKVIADLFGLPTYLEANQDVIKKWENNIKDTNKLIGGFDKLNLAGFEQEDTRKTDLFTTVARDNSSDNSLDDLKGIINGLNTTIAWIKDTLWPLLQPILNDVIPVVNELITAINNLLNSDFFKDVVQDTIDTVSAELKSLNLALEILNGKISWDKFWSDIATDVDWVEIGKKLLSKADPFFNLLTAVFDWVRKKLNIKIEEKDAEYVEYLNSIPKYEGEQKGGGTGLMTVTATANAKGGVYTTPHLGIVGEASTHSNPELITPQALLDDRIAAGNDRVLMTLGPKLDALLSAVQAQQMTVTIGDDVIARHAYNGNNMRYNLVGGGYR